MPRNATVAVPAIGVVDIEIADNRIVTMRASNGAVAYLDMEGEAADIAGVVTNFYRRATA